MINCNVCALAQNNFQINKIQQKHHDSISIDINHLNNTSNISEEETKQDAETPNGPGLLQQKQDLEHQIKTLWNQVKEESAISTSTLLLWSHQRSQALFAVDTQKQRRLPHPRQMPIQ